ncbi:MAG: Maf family protein [Firmicutes bacterium]|nr:Maf family protein [Bacillota bacterium]
MILASASPRRQELLKRIGLDFEVRPSTVEEKIDVNHSPEQVVKDLSFLKAKDIADKAGQNCIVIGADTIVVYQDKILGKPENKEHAYRMLSMLNGCAHRVLTGFTLIRTQDEKVIKRYEETLVKFRELSDAEIKAYIETGEPMDKAGAYGIQEIGSLIVERIEGDYFNVVGLPMVQLALALKKEFEVKIL